MIDPHRTLKVRGPRTTIGEPIPCDAYVPPLPEDSPSPVKPGV
jgi:hypothetical protein